MTFFLCVCFLEKKKKKPLNSYEKKKTELFWWSITNSDKAAIFS